MASAGNITAVLTLNATKFDSGLSEAKASVEAFERSLKAFSTNAKSMGSSLTALDKALVEAVEIIDKFNLSVGNLSNFKKFSDGVNKVANALRILSSSEIDVVESMNLINSMFNAFQGSLNGVEVKVKGVSTSIKELTASEEAEAPVTERVAVATQKYAQALEVASPPAKQLATGNKELASSESQVTSASNQATSSIQRQASASRTATASTQAQTSATNGLKNAFNSLKMVGSLVASMMVWNFASSMIEATRETVNAKSEMEGYFQMLHFSKSEIADFNNALEETVGKFKRINKYALGETISSIGVEFNLSTQEMKKAMPVVSMITSEYLRAGRNVNEASLAVKDILQGEFQRLSRETGVKGDQLREAGWSGDKKDVTGLLEALDVVGKSRNWDVFVEKANSLNDAILIMQNRFSEWTADMVYAVQPAIVGVFNMLMGTFEKFSGFATGIWEWLNSEGIAQSIVQWTGLATAITGVVTALIVYRTGANLTQIAQMGLTRTIGATILGLQAETVAEYGLRNAIVSRLTSIDAETVKEIGITRAIASKVLGVNAEAVAEMGLGRSLWATNTAREVEKLKAQENVTVINELVLAKAREEAGNVSGFKAIIGKIAGVEAETLAEQGLMVALAERIGISPALLSMYGAETTAELTTAEASVALMVSLTPLIAIVGALVVAFGSLAISMNESAQEMGRFNDLVENGESKLRGIRTSIKDYTAKQEGLKKKLAQTTKGTKEYARVQEELRNVNRDLVTLNGELEESTKAVGIAVGAQKFYEEQRTESAIRNQGKLIDAYIKAGYSSKEAYEMANDSMRDAENGAKQLYEALQKLNMADYRNLQGNTALLGMFEKNGVDEKTAQEQLKKFNDYNVMIEKGMEKGLTDESFFGRLDGWLTHYEGQLGKFWTNLESAFISGDVEGIFKNIGNGWKHFVKQHLPQGGIAKMIGDALGLEEGKEGEINWDNLNKLGGYIKSFLDEGGNMIHRFVTQGWDAIKNSLSGFNIFEAIGEIFTGGETNGGDSGLVMQMIDIPSIMQSITDFLGIDIQTWMDSFLADPLGTLGVCQIDLAGILFPRLFGLMEGATGIFTWVDTNIIQPLKQGISDGIASIPIISDIAQMLGLIPSQNQNAHDKGAGLMEQLKQAVEDKIRSIPIVGDIAQMLGLIPSQNSNANAKGHGIGENIKRGEADGHRGMADAVRDEVGRIISILNDKVRDAYNSAMKIGSGILQGFRDALGMNSPSIISKELIPDEFGVHIPNAITDNSEVVYNSAQTYAQQLYAGMNSVEDTGFGLGTVVDDYQTDAQTVSMYSQMMGMDTTMAFNDMSLAVNDTTMQMSTNVATSYSTMQQKQASLLQNMKTSNTSAYNEMYQKSNQSLIQMRDSTTNITNQMISAWGHMRTQLVATADALRSESTAHFNQLSNHIGSFYRKIQNPSSWGAGSPSSPQTRGARNSKVGKAFVNTITGRHGAGGNGTTGRYSPYRNNNTTMSLRQLKRMICPNGDCDGLFDGLDMSQVVNVAEFLSSIEGEHGFGWTGWNKTHYQYIRQKSNQWDMKSPILNVKGGIPTNAQFKVGEFENGRPQISFGAFQSMAESLFSAVPYAFYYDSDKYGSWQNALAHGECNCSDGADAIIAFAQTCGFSGYKQHGTWVDPDGSTYGHFYAVINGKKMDTTGWQQRRSWSAGSPSTSTKTPPNNKEVHIHIDMSNSTNYGMDNIEERIEEGVKRGLREQFNNPTTVVI